MDDRSAIIPFVRDAAEKQCDTTLATSSLPTATTTTSFSSSSSSPPASPPLPERPTKACCSSSCYSLKPVTPVTTACAAPAADFSSCYRDHVHQLLIVFVKSGQRLLFVPSVTLVSDGFALSTMLPMGRLVASPLRARR